MRKSIEYRFDRRRQLLQFVWVGSCRLSPGNQQTDMSIGRYVEGSEVEGYKKIRVTKYKGIKHSGLKYMGHKYIGHINTKATKAAPRQARIVQSRPNTSTLSHRCADSGVPGRLRYIVLLSAL